MTVGELIERLQRCPSDSEVLMATGRERVANTVAVEVYLCGQREVVIHSTRDVFTPAGVSEIVWQ